MASFCRQCSFDIWGEDEQDYAFLTTPEQNKSGWYTQALCEGCGPTLCDHAGNCVMPGCIEKHGVIVGGMEGRDLLTYRPYTDDGTRAQQATGPAPRTTEPAAATGDPSPSTDDPQEDFI